MSLVNQRLGFGWLSAFAAGQLGDAGKSLHLPVPHFPQLQSFGMCFEPRAGITPLPGAAVLLGLMGDIGKSHLVQGGFGAWLVASAQFCCCFPAGVVTLPCRVPNVST